MNIIQNKRRKWGGVKGEGKSYQKKDNACW